MDPAQVEKYKNRHVRIPQDLVDPLPNNLKTLLDKSDYVRFLRRIYQLLCTLNQNSAVPPLVLDVLQVLPELGNSSCSDVHDLVQEIYLDHTYLMPIEFYLSLVDYVNNAYYSDMRCVVPEEWIEDFEASLGMDSDDEGDDEDKADNLPTFSDQHPVPVIKADQIHNPFGYFTHYPMFRLSPCKYPRKAGTYALYYLGKRPLIDGFFSASSQQPLYIGMSTRNINNRLRDHMKKIGNSNLSLRDFGVRFVLVENSTDARKIEKVMIADYNPPWNRETLKFCFGNGRSRTNLWNKLYVQQVPEVCADLLEQLAIFEPSDD